MNQPLVTLAAAKLYLRLDRDNEDQLVTLFIIAASEAVRDAADGWVQLDGEPIPARIQLAVLSHVLNAYDNRPEVDLPASATGLVGPFRSLSI